MSRNYIALDAAETARQIEKLFTDFAADIGDDDELRAGLVEGETDLHSILSRIIDHRSEAEEMITGIKERQEGLKERLSRYEARKEAMTALALRLLIVAKQDKVTLPEATISVTKGRESVVIDNEADLPQGYVRTTIVPDKAAIAEAIKAGNEVPGAHMERGPSYLGVRK